MYILLLVVADTTKVRIFKQITTHALTPCHTAVLLLIPQRYEFSSKSQRCVRQCCIFYSCCWYHKGTNFQANHNLPALTRLINEVVADTTKVRIFKQITTGFHLDRLITELLLIPQRYEFSSKSQQKSYPRYLEVCCCWYHKGTNFQANHNEDIQEIKESDVVADTTKVRIFKQITTPQPEDGLIIALLLIPQRYEFSSKSQQKFDSPEDFFSCCWYHKGTNFQANHNIRIRLSMT